MCQKTLAFPFIALLHSQESRTGNSVMISTLSFNILISWTIQGLWSWRGSSRSWMALSRGRLYKCQKVSESETQECDLSGLSEVTLYEHKARAWKCRREEAFLKGILWSREVNLGSEMGVYVHRQDITK